MLHKLYKNSSLLILAFLFLYSCQKSPVEIESTPGQQDQSINTDSFSDNDFSDEGFSDSDFEDDATLSKRYSRRKFVHGPIVIIDGDEYYLAPGAPDGPNGATDIPGHFWKQITRNRLLGKHYNTGPFGKASWWSSDAPDGALLYRVHGIIDTWSMEKAKHYAKKGIVHYHEFVRVDDGTKHPTKILWFRHIAMRSFTLDGGPHPEMGHEVTPGIDWKFIPNGMMPYDPNN